MNRINSEQIERIAAYQGSGIVEPLTCGQAGHRPMEGGVRNGRVVLACPDCGQVQKRIPALPSRVELIQAKHQFEVFRRSLSAQRV